MCLATILAAVFLVPAPAPAPCRDAACLVSDGSSVQTPAENSQNPTPDQAPANAAGQKESDSKPDQAPAANEAGKPSPQKPPSSPAPSARKRRSRAHKTVPPAAEGEPHKIVVHQGGVSEPVAQILPGITLEEANRQRESAEQLLASAESHLKQLATRTLSTNQQEMVIQIRHYMDGARSALKDSDTQRAHTLALKAYLLSDDLVKH